MWLVREELGCWNFDGALSQVKKLIFIFIESQLQICQVQLKWSHRAMEKPPTLHKILA